MGHKDTPFFRNGLSKTSRENYQASSLDRRWLLGARIATNGRMLQMPHHMITYDIPWQTILTRSRRDVLIDKMVPSPRPRR